MGNLLAKFMSSKIQPSLLDIDVQSGSTELHNDADNVVPDLSSQSNSTLSSVSSGDTQQDGAVPGPSSDKRIVRKNLSIVSLISSESETSIINHYKQKQNLLEPGEPVSMTDISKIHGTGNSSGQADNVVNTDRSIETEQERLIREEQERLEREQQQQRAKTARMKRRCELYGGSRADISKGDNSIKLAESVLHLIHQNAESTKISSSTSKMQNYLATTKPPPTPNFPHRLKDFGLKSSLDELDTSKASITDQSTT
ncbi:uncharacterized protein [Clytia hemisphaerica]|uniref:uncharacterized protein isoform X2 n=1 Tax=Clytia hemisphaerica TaxID=252671 RepID=UPI0034D63925